MEEVKMNINYIETTLNGYIIKRIKICEYRPGKDYLFDLSFELGGEEVEYCEEFSGDLDELDAFLETGSNESIIAYQDVNHLNTKSNVYLEYWKTDSLGWFEDRYVGLEISNKEEIK